MGETRWTREFVSRQEASCGRSVSESDSRPKETISRGSIQEQESFSPMTAAHRCPAARRCPEAMNSGRLTGSGGNPPVGKRSAPEMSGGDRTRTDAQTPEKNAIPESGAAECGVVALDAANGTENDPELRLLIEARPSLSMELRLAIVAIVRTGLATRSDHLQGSLPNGPDDE